MDTEFYSLLTRAREKERVILCTTKIPQNANIYAKNNNLFRRLSIRQTNLVKDFCIPCFGFQLLPVNLALRLVLVLFGSYSTVPVDHQGDIATLTLLL
jgi:hypothetical protein